MPGIVEFPQVVQHALAQYGDLFANECQRRHFAEYLTGLMVAERQSVLGINREFAQTTDQSCLHRFLTDAAWDAGALNQRRWEELPNDPSTRYSDQGVIPIANTLSDRDGMLIPDAGWYWDHAEERNKIAQDYLVANYVGTKSNRKLEGKGPILKAHDLAASIPASDRKEMRLGERRQWYFRGPNKMSLCPAYSNK